MARWTLVVAFHVSSVHKLYNHDKWHVASPLPKGCSHRASNFHKKDDLIEMGNAHPISCCCHHGVRNRSSKRCCGMFDEWRNQDHGTFCIQLQLLSRFARRAFTDLSRSYWRGIPALLNCLAWGDCSMRARQCSIWPQTRQQGVWHQLSVQVAWRTNNNNAWLDSMSLVMHWWIIALAFATGTVEWHLEERWTVVRN